MALTRRVVLGLAGAAAIVGATATGIEEDALPGRVPLHELLGLNGPDGPVPDTTPGEVREGVFDSVYRREPTGYAVAYPPGVAPDGLPVVVALHMLRRDHSDLFGPRMALQNFLAEAVAGGLPPFAIAAADGGNSYWHLRPGGVDAGAMVVEEFLPLLREQGLDVSRIAFLGWSMGGYGALRLGGILGPERVAAVSVAAPAIWTDPADASTSGFASEQEYLDYTVFGREAELREIPVQIFCGRGDPFLHSVEEYAEGLAADSAAAGGAVKKASFPRGAHDPGFWRRVLPEQLEFVGSRLT